MSKPANTQYASEDGFVLVEILCALVIIGIASIGFLHLSSSSTSRTFLAQSFSQAESYAAHLLIQERQKLYPDIREQQGESLGSQYEWRVSVTALEEYMGANNEQPMLARIVIVVISNNDSQPELIRLEHIQAYGRRS